MSLAAKMNALPLPNQVKEVRSKMSIVGEGFAPQHDRRQKSVILSIRKLVKKAF